MGIVVTREGFHVQGLWLGFKVTSHHQTLHGYVLRVCDILGQGSGTLQGSEFESSGRWARVEVLRYVDEFDHLGCRA